MLPQTFIWFLEKMHYLQIENVVFICLLTYLSFKKKNLCVEPRCIFLMAAKYLSSCFLACPLIFEGVEVPCLIAFSIYASVLFLLA